MIVIKPTLLLCRWTRGGGCPQLNMDLGHYLRTSVSFASLPPHYYNIAGDSLISCIDLENIRKDGQLYDWSLAIFSQQQQQQQQAHTQVNKERKNKVDKTYKRLQKSRSHIQKLKKLPTVPS